MWTIREPFEIYKTENLSTRQLLTVHYFSLQVNDSKRDSCSAADSDGELAKDKVFGQSNIKIPNCNATEEDEQQKKENKNNQRRATISCTDPVPNIIEIHIEEDIGSELGELLVD